MQDIAALAARMTLPDESVRKAAVTAVESAAGTAGRLGDLAAWLAASQGQWPPEPIDDPVLIVMGDQPAPAALVELAAVRVTTTSAESADTAAAMAQGARIASDEIDSGAGMVLLAGGDVLPAAATTAVLTNEEIAAVVGHGPGTTDRDWIRACAEVRDTARRARPHAGAMTDMLEALASPSVAMAAGIVAEAAARRTPVVLDDVAPMAAGLVAQRISYRTARWFCAAQESPDPAHVAALERLRLTPVVDYGLGAGFGRSGVAALLALAQLRGVVAVFADEAPS